MSSGPGPEAKCALCGQPTSGSSHLCTNPLSKYLGAQIDGRYLVEHVLGKGGMGVVFGAVQTSVHRPVAIKMLHPSLAATPEFFERFRREAELASRLHHPNIITVFDFGQTKDGGCYYVMERVQGESLRALVRREGPLPIARAVRITEQIGRALAAAHAAGVIHRDLKPHNVMCGVVDGGDYCKVLDFGLVKALEEEDGGEAEQLTTTGQVLGTPSYMAPEQAAGESLDQRADLFALAATLYFCLTGAPPCKTNSAHRALAMMMNGEIPPVAARRAGAPIPESLEAFLRRALAFSPDDRPQTADLFIAQMKAALAGASPAVLEARPEGAIDLQDSGTSSSRLSRGPKPAAARVAQAAAAGSGPEAPRSKAGLVALVVAAVALCGVLGVGAKAVLSPEPVAAAAPVAPVVARPVEPARPRAVAVRIETEPSGARIFRGEELLGVTPADLLLQREAVNLILRREGYLPYTKGVDLTDAKEPVQLKLELVAQPAAKPAEPRPVRPASKRPAGPEIPTFED